MVNYSFSQAGNDLSQVAPIIALSAALLIALVVDLFLGRRRAGFVVAIIAGVGYAVAAGLAILLWDGGGSAYHGFATGDHLARFFEVLFGGLGVATVLVSHGYLKKRAMAVSEFHIILLAASTGMMALAAATSLVSVFVSLELLSVSLYIATGYDRSRTTSQEAAVKYLMVGGFASAFLLYGMALLYGATGSTVLSEIAQKATATSNPLLMMVVILLGAGLAFKISGAPFHQWTPDVYQGAPLPVTGFMSVGTKAAAFVMIIRIFNDGLPHLSGEWQLVLALVAAASLVVGNLMAIIQTSVKRLLAYSSVAQAGYLLIGVIAGGKDGLAAVMFYLAAYTVMNFGAFAILTLLSGPHGDTDRISDLEGMGRRHPYLGLLMTIFMLSLAGFPPSVGFVGKLWLFTAGVNHGFIWLVVLAVLASVVSVYYYARVLMRVWDTREAGSAELLARPGVVVVAVAALAVIALGVLPGLLLAVSTTGAWPPT
ncbi:MAG TPA: NADH-quinone oxidoreductase subunit N [Candidatus Dormibacteraeota bacterium]|jgi:NADH-quinone oxidoreductase subunit N|nr:NADH-quinone oxidoreductase subunit N [Candidatus Dormibacteraeota bacterium]